MTKKKVKHAFIKLTDKDYDAVASLLEQYVDILEDHPFYFGGAQDEVKETLAHLNHIRAWAEYFVKRGRVG